MMRAVGWLVLLVMLAGATEIGKPFVQMGHVSGMTSSALSADGRFLVTGGADGTIKFWDIGSHREIKTVSLAEGQYKVSIHASGMRVASINFVAFTPDGVSVVAGSSEDEMMVIDAYTGEIKHRVPMRGIIKALSPDGTKVLVQRYRNVKSVMGKTFDLCDTTTGKVVRTYGQNINGYNSGRKPLKFTADGKVIIGVNTTGFGSIDYWDTSTGNLVSTYKGKEYKGYNFYASAVSADQKYLVVGGKDKVTLWDFQSKKLLRTFKGLKGDITDVGFNRDPSLIQARDPNGLEYVWNMSTGKVVSKKAGFNAASFLKAIKGLDYYIAVTHSTDGALMLCSKQNVLELWDAVNGKKLRSIEDEKLLYVAAMAFSPDAETVAVALTDGIVLLNVSDATVLQRFPMPQAGIDKLIFSPDGNVLYAYSSHQDAISVWDIPHKKLSKTIKVDGMSTAVFSPDRKLMALVVSATDKKRIALFDLEKQKIINRFWSYEYPTALTFSPDNRHLLSGDERGNIKLWSVSQTSDQPLLHLQSYGNVKKVNGKIVHSKTGHKGKINALAFSPNGKYVLSGSQDAHIKLWDISNGRELRDFTGHSKGVVSVAFGEEKESVISVSGDATAIIWDLSSAKQRLTMISFDDMEWVAATPEGYFNASEGGARHLNVYAGGLTVTSLDAFYDLFYRPDLVTLKAEGKDITQLAKLDIKDVLRQTPPEVEITTVTPEGKTNRVKVCYKIESTGGGVGEVRLFHNGKLFYSDGEYKDSIELSGTMAKLDGITTRSLQEKTRALQKKKTKADPTLSFIITKPKPETVTACSESFSVSGDNEYAVLAFNATNTVSSELRTQSYHSKLPKKEPKLYMVTIGVNDFKDMSANLSFAAKDSRDILQKFSDQAQTLFEKENIETVNITNDRANKANILNTIADLASRVEPQDYIVLFVASHGIVLDGQYYIVTHDYDGTLDPAKMVSSNEIIDLTKKLASLNQLLILDTCHAGGIDNIISGLYDSKVSVLAKKSGLHIYASANSKEEALDGYKGNGLFTYTILEGLDNNPAADRRNRGLVSIQDLGGFSKEKTEKISKGLGHLQTPTIIHFGKDADIYKIQAR